MNPSAPLVTLSEVHVTFHLGDVAVRAVTNAELQVHPGELLAVVGESGCGKSVLAHALLGLLPANATVTGTAMLTAPTPGAHIGTGSRDLLAATQRDLARHVRGRLVGLIPQSPATALNPVRSGRAQVEETLRAHGHSASAARTRAVSLAVQVGLDAADLDLFAHQMSGGMAQRLATALALAPDPVLLLADEPTTGLDRPLAEATVDLLRARCDAGAGVLLITHDLAAAERVADTVAVMYASRIVETSAASDLFAAPRHPYTAALLDAQPDRAFRAIPGQPPLLTRLPTGCAYAARCERADATCGRQPVSVPAGRATTLACHHPLEP